MGAVSVRKQSWVEARVDGTTVLSRIMNAGESHRLDAREAVTLSSGNAGGVEYSLNGAPAVPLGREGEVRRNVVITVTGASAGTSGPAPIRATSPRPRRPSPTPDAAPIAAPIASPEPGA